MTAGAIRDVRDDIASGRVTALARCERTLDALERHGPPLGAVVTLARDRALARAAAIDADPSLRALPLAGVPIAVKDNICTEGLRTTAGSRILADFVPPYDATAVARLEAAGALIVAKTNCDEFAMGSSNENSAHGPARNPWALDRAPGGSSGGSAALVSAGLVPAALGSDTGGSVRQPAAFCGVVGLKPTYGRVSRYGLIAFGSSLDQIGPLTRSAEDAALVLSVIAGHDPRDATSSRHEVPAYETSLVRDLTGLRIGVPRRLLQEGVDADVLHACEAALEVFVDQGARLVEVELPHAAYAIPVYYLIATAEASSNLARYDGVRYGFRAPLGPDDDLHAMYDRTRDLGFGVEVKRRIVLGTYVLSAGYYEAYYLKAQQVRTLIQRDFDEAFTAVDVVATPTSPTPAFRLGERVDDPLQMYLADVFTVSANLAGLPGISLPCGLAAGRLPIGLQFVGRPFDEATLLAAAHAFERHTRWAGERPPFPTA